MNIRYEYHILNAAAAQLNRLWQIQKRIAEIQLRCICALLPFKRFWIFATELRFRVYHHVECVWSALYSFSSLISDIRSNQKRRKSLLVCYLHSALREESDQLPGRFLVWGSSTAAAIHNPHIQKILSGFRIAVFFLLLYTISSSLLFSVAAPSTFSTFISFHARRV